MCSKKNCRIFCSEERQCDYTGCRELGTLAQENHDGRTEKCWTTFSAAKKMEVQWALTVGPQCRIRRWYAFLPKYWALLINNVWLALRQGLHKRPLLRLWYVSKASFSVLQSLIDTQSSPEVGSSAFTARLHCLQKESDKIRSVLFLVHQRLTKKTLTKNVLSRLYQDIPGVSNFSMKIHFFLFWALILSEWRKWLRRTIITSKHEVKR